MTRLNLLGASMAFVFVSACSQPTLVGTWEADGMAKRTVELGSDGKATFTVSAGQEVTLSGDYKVTGNRLVVTNIQLPSGLPLPSFAQSFVPDKIEATFSWKNSREVVFTGDRFLEGGFKRKE